MSEELKPCPFCGGDAIISDQEWEHGYTAHVAVICSKCCTRGLVVDFHIQHNCGGIGSIYRRPYENKAITAWNTRTDPAQEIATLRAENTQILADQEAILKSHTEEQERADKAEAEVLRLREALNMAGRWFGDCAANYRSQRMFKRESWFSEKEKYCQNALANGTGQASS